MRHQGSAREMVTEALGRCFPNRKLKWSQTGKEQSTQFSLSSGPFRNFWVVVESKDHTTEVYFGRDKTKNKGKALYLYSISDDGTELHEIPHKDFRDLNVLVKAFVFAVLLISCLSEIKWERAGEDVSEEGAVVH